jgi:hypothetical protein
MNKKLTAALIAAGTLPFAAQALELSVDYNPSFGDGEGLIADTTLFATLDTETGALALGTDRSTAVIEDFAADDDDVLSRVVENALVVNLLTGETGFVRASGFAATELGDDDAFGGEDADADSEYASYLISRAITPNGNGTFDYASAFQANVSAGDLDFTASSDLAAFAGVTTVADIRAQIRAGLAGN